MYINRHPPSYCAALFLCNDYRDVLSQKGNKSKRRVPNFCTRDLVINKQLKICMYVNEISCTLKH